QRCYVAYERIFQRAGCKNVIAVLSDSGMMGGRVSHEFMLLTAIGEDTLVLCDNCDFKANIEACASVVDNSALSATEALTLVPTPEMATIEEVAGYLHKPHNATCKAVVYQRNTDDSYVIAFVRGDLEVHETKLRNTVGAEIHPAIITPESGIVAGFIGPKGLDTKKITVLFDRSLEGIGALVCGANQQDYHYTGFNIERDYGKVSYVDVARAIPGGICPVCGKPQLAISNGIEVGNIFQLGDKYTKSMNMQYLDENGALQYPIMGCYGIGVGRLAASVCEESHDDYGPIWPISIAPWEAQICVLRADQEEPKRVGEELYAALQKAGVETMIDDRPVSAGVVFSEADLIGAPIRLTVSPRNLASGMIELTTRDKRIKKQIPVAEALPAVLELKAQLFAEIMEK
ncbi:MAG: YbaK/EbsC family protein, partial [Eubacteriales bacterium]|nr:YbaK/EbsC family protein [Eubacteriales bacterium]